MTTNVYVSSVAYAAVAQWAASHSYSLGNYVRQLASPTFGNERVFKCTTAGTSGSSEPAWTLTNNGTTTDNTAHWTQVGGQETEQAAGNWKAPLANINAAATLITGGTGVQIFVSNDHVESEAAAYTLSADNCNFVISVSRLGATLPPTDTDYLRGASVKTTGNNALTITSGFFQGIDFKCGDSTTGSPALTLANGNNHFLELNDCSLELGVTAGTSSIIVGTSTTFPGSVRLFNTPIKFNAVGQFISLTGAMVLEWYGTKSGAIAGAAVPTHLFTYASNTPPSRVLLHGLDMSSFSGALFNGAPWGAVDMWDCKLHASMTLPTPFAVTSQGDQSSYFRMTNCDDSTNARNYRFAHYLCQCVVASDSLIARTGGASDGVTGYSHRYTPNNQNSNFLPKLVSYLNWISRRVNSVGSSVTLTMEFISFASRALTNLDVWLEVEVLDSSGVPLASLITSRANLLASGTAIATTTSIWNGNLSNRQNTHAYAVGDTFTLASNSSRAFMVVTSSGSSASSEPAGYATAVDGTSITDGSLTVVAGRRYKLTATFTPAVKGIVRCRPVVSFSGITVNSNICCFDPKLLIA